MGIKKIKKDKLLVCFSFEMEYTYESNRIEGNTLTLQETALVVGEGVTIGGKSMKEHLEAINHAQAIEMETNGNHPVLTAAFLHEELVKIHPFIDGNGRTSRLLMNLYLLSKGYTITVLKGDNEAKQAYYTALEQSHVDNNHEPFYLLTANTVKQSLEKYLRVI